MPKKIDLTGMKFGRLTAVKTAPKTDSHTRWECLCECGKTIETRYQCLARGETKSCGCLKSETTIAKNTKHGQNTRRSATTEYTSWASVIQRCTNPNSHRYARYGGRGIKVCERWVGPDGFSNFFSDMGKKPDKSYTIERVDNNGNYSPDNCVWASKSTQAKNRSTTRFFTIGEETLCVADWARRHKISRRALNRRLIDQGLDIETAINLGKQSIVNKEP